MPYASYAKVGYGYRFISVRYFEYLFLSMIQLLDNNVPEKAERSNAAMATTKPHGPVKGRNLPNVYIISATKLENVQAFDRFKQMYRQP